MTNTLPKMNPEAKALWLKALRSGDYTQARGRLITSEYDETCGEIVVTGHCCLAVLTALYVEHDGKGVRVECGQVLYETNDPNDDELIREEDEDLCPQVQRWAGLTSDNPEIAPGLRAIEANDGTKTVLDKAPLKMLYGPDYRHYLQEQTSAPLDFFQIADLIEENL